MTPLVRAPDGDFESMQALGPVRNAVEQAYQKVPAQHRGRRGAPLARRDD